MNIDQDEHYDFMKLVALDTPSLLMELAATHGLLANLHGQVAFLRQEEERKTPGAKAQRLDMESVRDAYIEKKWLIMELLRHTHA
jgi:hypothetical protein